MKSVKMLKVLPFGETVFLGRVGTLFAVWQTLCWNGYLISYNDVNCRPGKYDGRGRVRAAQQASVRGRRGHLRGAMEQHPQDGAHWRHSRAQVYRSDFANAFQGLCDATRGDFTSRCCVDAQGVEARGTVLTTQL